MSVGAAESFRAAALGGPEPPAAGVVRLARLTRTPLQDHEAGHDDEEDDGSCE